MVRADAKIDAIRQAMPATQGQAYLNTGTTGPLPRVCYEAMQAEAQHEFERGRGGIQGFLDFRDKLEAFREQMARLYTCAPGEVAFTHHTTEGMNFALWGLDWREGDEAITTSVEH